MQELVAGDLVIAGHHVGGVQEQVGGHLYGSDVEAVGVAMNDLLTRNCGQNVGTGAD